MKIHGGGPPKGPTKTRSESVKPKREGRDFSSVVKDKSAQGADSAASTQSAQQTGSAHAAIPPEKVSEIASKLRAGKVSRSEAADLIVDEVVKNQLGSAASPEMKEKVAARLREVLENDPFLSRKLQSLGAENGSA